MFDASARKEAEQERARGVKPRLCCASISGVGVFFSKENYPLQVYDARCWKALYPSAFGIALCMAAGHQLWPRVGEYTRRASVASALQKRNQTMRSLGLLRAPRPFQALPSIIISRSTQEALHRLRSAIDDAYDSIGVDSRGYVPVMVPAGMPLGTIHT